MNPLDFTRLTPLMERTRGIPEVTIGLIDGPVALNHPTLAALKMREISKTQTSACNDSNSMACLHGTLVAGVLYSISPGCTFLLRPIFNAVATSSEALPSATPEELATAIVDTVKAGARVINMSVALAHPSSRGERALEEALDYAVARGVIIVAAAGNQGTLGSTAITRHAWVIPVAACDLRGRPMDHSNLGSSISKRGLCGPGDGVMSLNAQGGTQAFGGTSAATPFVTGTMALLWSEFPAATATDIRHAVVQSHPARRATLVPPVLDAWAAYQAMNMKQTRRVRS